MNLSLVSCADGVRCLACSGAVTMMTIQGDDPMGALIGLDGFSRTVLLDLGKTTYIDSTAVGWLLGLHKKFKQAGGQLILHSVPPLVDQVFQLLKLPTVLHVASNETTARALAEG
jgi:anti-sigma B factor antagonist